MIENQVICPKCNEVSDNDSIDTINMNQQLINGENQVICPKCKKSSPWKDYVWTKESMPQFPAGTHTVYNYSNSNIPVKPKNSKKRISKKPVVKKPVLKKSDVKPKVKSNVCLKCKKTIDYNNLTWSSIGPNLAYHDKCSALLKIQKEEPKILTSSLIVSQKNSVNYTELFLDNFILFSSVVLLLFVCSLLTRIRKYLKKDIKMIFERKFIRNPVEKKFAGLTYNLSTDQYVNLRSYFKSMGKDLTSAVNFLESCRGIAFLEEFSKSQIKLRPTEISKMIIDAERNEQILECVVDILENYSTEEKE